MSNNEPPISEQESPEELDAETLTTEEEAAQADGEEAQAESPVTEESGDIAKLMASLEEAHQRIDELSDQAVRAAAEQQNVRRRAERDVENAHKYGTEKLIKDLLAVVDSLERGIEALDAEDEVLKPAREGMSLTLKMLNDVFGKHGVLELNPLGEPFDPQQHEAMSMVENPDAEPNSIVTVLQKGYALNERLVRPAMVIVAKAPSA